jgi:serine/threonine protein kinase
MAKGLQYIHSMNLVHRDIKPENMMISITQPVLIKLADFGLCKPVNQRGTFSISGIKGTQYWMVLKIQLSYIHFRVDKFLNTVDRRQKFWHWRINLIVKTMLKAPTKVEVQCGATYSLWVWSFSPF